MKHSVAVLKEGKMKRYLLLGAVLFCMVPNTAWSGHDDHHITFVNQTKKHLKFEVKITGHDKHKTLHSHTANYVHIDDCNGKDGKAKNFEIKIKHVLEHGIDAYLKDKDGNDLTAHRKCGENLYIWHQDGEYRINDEPHIAADLSACSADDSKPAILFAHGYNDSQKAWGKFAEHAEKKGWRVFRTSVSQDGSIAKRAHMLAIYIDKAADQCNIKDGSLRVVGHSMGGLDLRYMVGSSKHRSAAKKIERMYTISSPHQGDSLGYIASAGSDAARDLTPAHMEKYNDKHPYSDFKVDGVQVPLLALRFKCGEQGNSDGVVGVNNQVLEGAPYTQEIYTGRHAESAKNCVGVTPELEQTHILDMILKDNRSRNKEGVIFQIPYNILVAK
jgi:pimeloyl-ACP methyl ester carboxylesterase